MCRPQKQPADSRLSCTSQNALIPKQNGMGISLLLSKHMCQVTHEPCLFKKKGKEPQ